MRKQTPAKELAKLTTGEESTGQVIANADTFGWDLPDLAVQKLFFWMHAWRRT